MLDPPANNASVNLSVNLAGLRLANPVMTASGTSGFGPEFAELTEIRKLGAFVTKAISVKPRKGNPPERIIETRGGMLNAIGLQNVGARAFVEEKLPLLRQYDTRVIANVFGYSDEDYIEAIQILKRHPEALDLIIPRGGKELKAALAGSAVPILPHFDGICHTYVDRAADLAMAEEICFNAKCSRPSVCNAMETLLVHREVATRFLPPLAERMERAGVELRGCERTRSIVHGATPASDADWDTEFLDLILSVNDTGAGLTDAEKARIGERFFRGPRHTNTTSGSGLGLWIARAFVVANGGKIEANSTGADQGTTVSIHLPLAPDAPQLEAAPDD